MHDTTATHTPSDATMNVPAAAMTENHPALPARPILDVLLREEIHNCIVVVTRYFGGTLLGTGGLVRAYQAATQAGLAPAPS